MVRRILGLSRIATTIGFGLALSTAAHVGAAPPAKAAPMAAVAGKIKVSDADVTAFEREAMKCRIAADALELYNEFIATADLTPRQKRIVVDRQSVWQERVDKKLVRLGTEWVTFDRARTTAKKADDLIEQAFAKIEAGEYKRAKELFDRAVKEDPSGVRAHYYLGMLNSPNLWNYAFAAEQQFEVARKRDPENASILNNLAISRLKIGRYGDAVDLWAQALRDGPERPEVVQNLGRFLKEDTAKRIPVTDALAKRAKKIYEKAIAEKKGAPFSETTGWLYSPLLLSVDERERTDLALPEAKAPAKQAPDPKPNANRVLSGCGTGFVIKPGFVLSNRHVAQGGTSYSMFQPKPNEQEHAATLISVADNYDLALFRCEALMAPEVPLNIELPGRASEVLVLGFPFGDALGDSIKAVRGTVYGFADDAKQKLVMYEANTNPGNSGGPVCDNTGRVVAVHFQSVILAALHEHGFGKVGCGVPINEAMPFIKRTLPDLKDAGVGEKLEWPAVDKRISESVVMVKLFVENLPFVQKPPTTRNANVFEDCTCTACKGRGKIPCPVRGCFKGSVAEFEASYTINGVGAGRQVLQWQTPRNRACKGCGGAGVIDCPHCQNGLDPTLVNISVPTGAPVNRGRQNSR